MNIVYIRMYLVYLVLTYKERLISTVFATFLAISEVLAISYLRAFIIVVYQKFSCSYSLFYSFFHAASKLTKYHL